LKNPYASLTFTEKNIVRALICLAVAFLLEITVFQYNRYGTLFADGPADNLEYGDLANVSDDPEHPVYMARDNAAITLRFADLNMRVASVHIEPVFVKSAETGVQAKTMTCYVKYNDEESTDRYTSDRVIVKGLEHTEYIPIYAIGKVSELTVVFREPHGAFAGIELNKTAPLTPVVLRVIIVAAIFFIIGTLRRYNIFSLKFDASSKKQNVIFAAVLAAFSVYCGFLTVLGYEPNPSSLLRLGSDTYRWEDQYNYLADALIGGRLDIDPQLDVEELLNLENQHDWNRLRSNNIDFPHDTSLYNGKFYVYFGIVPCILLYLPYNLITGGGHLPNWAASFLVCSASLIFLSLAWRELVKRFFPKIPYVTFLLGSFVLSFCQFTLFVAVRAAQYGVATISGLSFTALGLFLLFKFAFNERKRLAVLVFSCLSFALAVGCRPTMAFWSVFVPILVWDEVKNKSTRLKTITAVAIPYIIIAIPLMWYNYARFDSATEFGQRYMLTGYNLLIHTAYMTPVEFFHCVIKGSAEGFYFELPRITTVFPFVETVPISNITGSWILSFYDSGVIGVLTLPVIWFLFKIRSVSGVIREKNVRFGKAFVAGVCVFVFISLISPFHGGVIIRYSVDFMWFAVLSSLVVICALLYKHANTVMAGVVEKLSGAAMFASSMIGLGITFTGDCARMITSSPQVYYYLKRAMTFFAGE